MARLAPANRFVPRGELREELRNSHDEGPAPTVAHHQVTTFDLPLTHAAEAATGGRLSTPLPCGHFAGFLLLDEWTQHTARDSSEEYVAVLDTEIP